jgi:hypothetical protein
MAFFDLRMRMVTQETRFNSESVLATECRLALEKNLGMKVPKPNCLRQVANLNKQAVLEEQ